MLDIYGIEANRRALLADLKQLIEEALQPFADDLREFLERVRGGAFGPNWRDAWDTFVETQADAGFNIEADSASRLVQLMESWERGHKAQARILTKAGATTSPTSALLSAVQALQTDRAIEPSSSTFVQREIARKPAVTGHGFFNSKLDEAQACLTSIKEALEAVGQKLDGSEVDESVDVDSDVDAVEELIWRYNDAVESARAAWLRENLSGNDNTRLLQMRTPLSLGLPQFVDDGQAERARRQLAQISHRLGVRDERQDRLITGLRVLDWAATAAGLLAGGGIVIHAAKTGGKWAVVKTIAIGAGGMAIEQATESGLRGLGAGEQTIRGVRLAAAIISLIFLRRKRGIEAEAESKAPLYKEGPENPRRPRSEAPTIEGTLDRPRTKYHLFLQQAVAEEMQAMYDYERIATNTSMSKFLGRKFKNDIRPDAIGLTRDGKVDMVEILSPGQTKVELEDKLSTAMNQLPSAMRGEFIAIDPKDAFK